MDNQPGIHINKIAPPTYAEAMAQTTIKDNESVSPSRTREQYPQTSSYLPSISGYQQQNNFYPNTSTQPSYIPPCVPSATGQQSQGSSSMHYIVHTERVVHRKRWKDRYCGKKVTTAILCFVIVIIVVQWLVVRSV